MKLVYTNENRFQVNNVKNILENEGYSISLKNEYIGGAAGDLSPFDTWLEIWVEDDDYDKAALLIQSVFERTKGKDWVCSQCKEKNDASFEYCWKCENQKAL